MGEDRGINFSFSIGDTEIKLIDTKVREAELSSVNAIDHPSQIFGGVSGSIELNLHDFQIEAIRGFVDTERVGDRMPDYFDAMVKTAEGETYLKGVKPVKVATMYWDMDWMKYCKKHQAYLKHLKRVRNREILHSKKPKKRKVRR